MNAYLISLILLIFPDTFSQRLFPPTFSLKEVNRLTPVEHQSWGTCWCFATTTAIQSAIVTEKLFSPVNLSEYHIDKFNGFNKNGLKPDTYDEGSGQGPQFLGSNFDDLSNGLVVHQGGNFKIAMAYLANNGGAVVQHVTLNSKHTDYDKFGNRPDTGITKLQGPTYLPHNINLLSTSTSRQRRRFYIKHAILTRGAVATWQFSQVKPYGYHIDNLEVHYYNGFRSANHAINLIGWDDTVEIHGHKGAWLAQDSWHKDEPSGNFIKYFYVLYDDIHTASEGEGGGVSFTDVHIHHFKHIYNHALHGWMYTLHDASINKVKNRYHVTAPEIIAGVSIYTTAEHTSGEISIINDGQNILTKAYRFKFPGFHYIDFSSHKTVIQGMTEIIQHNQNSQYAYDASGKVQSALGEDDWDINPPPTLIHSRSLPNESCYMQNGIWKDFSNFTTYRNGQSEIKDNRKNRTANFALILYTDPNE